MRAGAAARGTYPSAAFDIPACIDSAVRDACDLGYLVTVPTDACTTLSPERHEWALRNNRGYCRQITTDELVREIDGLVG